MRLGQLTLVGVAVGATSLAFREVIVSPASRGTPTPDAAIGRTLRVTVDDRPASYETVPGVLRLVGGNLSASEGELMAKVTRQPGAPRGCRRSRRCGRSDEFGGFC